MLGTAFTPAAHATQPLSAFIERATTQNFDTRESVATLRQREAESGAALGRLLPSFTARGIYTRNQYETRIQLSPNPMSPPLSIVLQRYNQLDALLQLDVQIIDLANFYRYRSQRAIAASQSEIASATTLDVSAAVSQAYYQFVGASALARAARLSVKTAEDNLRNVEDRRAAGVATDFDRERALANVARAQQDVADADLGVQLSNRSLETLSGLSPLPSDGLPEDDLHEEAPLERWMALAGESPKMRAAKQAEEAARAGQKAAAFALLPTLSASGQEHVTNAAGLAGHSSYYTLQLIASLRLDYSTYATANAQSAATQVTQIRAERTARGVSDALFQAYQRVQAGVVKSRAARIQASAATRASELASERYGAGVATQLDVTQAQRDAFLADAARIQADADLAAARAQLRYVVGKEPPNGRTP